MRSLESGYFVLHRHLTSNSEKKIKPKPPQKMSFSRFHLPKKTLFRRTGACKFRSRCGLSTTTSILALLLMLAALTGMVTAYYNYGLSVKQQASGNQERAQEEIQITMLETDGTYITSVTVSNTGTIEVKIRALYKINEETTFLVDPSENLDTHIASHDSLSINIASLQIDKQATVVAATERGTISKGVSERLFEQENPSSGVDTSGLTIGPLMLTFDSLNWARVDDSGNVQGDWSQTWTIPTGPCAWRLNLTNIDDQNRSLTINQYSGFTTSLVSSPVTTTWFLRETQYTLEWNSTLTVYFVWIGPQTFSAQTAGSNSRGVNNVFLTLFGTFSDGNTYAQTIPFEAITIA